MLEWCPYGALCACVALRSEGDDWQVKWLLGLQREAISFAVERTQYTAFKMKRRSDLPPSLL